MFSLLALTYLRQDIQTNIHRILIVAISFGLILARHYTCNFFYDAYAQSPPLETNADWLEVLSIKRNVFQAH